MAKLGGTLNAICAKLLQNNNNVSPKVHSPYLVVPDKIPKTCSSPHQADEEGSRDDEASRDHNLEHVEGEWDGTYQNENVFENNNEPLKEAVVDLSIKLQNKQEKMMGMSPSPYVQNGYGFSRNEASDDDCEDAGKSHMRSGGSSPKIGIFEEDSLVYNVSSSNLTSTPASNSKRSRRKNTKPKNIAQFSFKDAHDDLVKDELEVYEINNRDVDFSVAMEEEVLDLSGNSESLGKSGEIQQEDESSNLTDTEQDVVLDLSVNRSNGNSNCFKPYAKTKDLDDTIMHNDTPKLGGDITSVTMETDADELATTVRNGKMLSSDINTADSARRSQPEGAAADATVIKNYAQNTMNELLSMYGLGESEACDITQSVPLQNFSSGRILERHLIGGIPIQKPAPQPAIKLQMESNRSISSDMVDKVTAVSKNLVTLPAPPLPVAVAPMKLPVATSQLECSPSSPPSRTSESHSNEGIYAKFVDSVSKLAQLPQGTMIGSPPVLLPRKFGNASALLQLASSVHQQGAPTVLAGTTYGSSQEHPQPSSISPAKAQTAKFAQSAEYIRACFNPVLAPKLATATGKNLLPDYGKYVRRYANWEECGSNHCKDMAYREHFHCMDCSFRVFVKKEEMIRHFKWHKKREESLQHGFMRYSPMDDCVKKFGPCTHNGKQTHYHCLQKGCNKVYISTSDVQMHANYHRKDSAIIQEGFQRFRATEDCGTTDCSFYGQRTTHFHCRRPGCSFTFKNKADMEKHKTYHQKDEVLGRDGFKKFMKYEHCSYTGCRYSKVSNHIHCIRPGCDYVLHSTGQLFSHKRKHERRDFEHAYRRFKDEQKSKHASGTDLASPPGGTPEKSPTSMSSAAKQEAEYIDMEDLSMMSKESQDSSPLPSDLSSQSLSMFKMTSPSSSQLNFSLSSVPSTPGTPDMGIKLEPGSRPLPSTLAKLASKLTGSSLGDSLTLPIPSYGDEARPDEAKQATQDEQTAEIPVTSPEGFTPTATPSVNEKRERDESWKRFLTRFTANDPCHPRCQFLYKDHYHCNTKGCGMLFRSKDGVREHARYHLQQNSISSLSYKSYTIKDDCVPGCKLARKESHYHCLWADCKQVVRENDPPFSRLEHHKIHEFSRSVTNRQSRQFTMYKFHDMVKRRRGRPPKYPKTEIPVVPKYDMNEAQITQEMENCKDPIAATILANGFKRFTPPNLCPDEKCLYHLKEHFHCVRPRCHHATDRADVLNLHAKDFHSYINILEGFEFFDRNVNCRRPHCHNNRANKHFHCVRTKCDYSFVRYSTMAQHDKKHRLAESEKSVLMSPVILPGAVAVVNSPVTIAIPGPPPPGPCTPQSTASLGNSQMNLNNSPLFSSPLDKDRNVVKAAGTFYPLSGLSSPQQGPVVAVSSVSPIVATSVGGLMPHTLGVHMVNPGVVQAASNAPILVTSVPSSAPMVHSTSNLVNIAPKPAPATTTVGSSGLGMPLTMLLKQKQSNFNPQLNWLTLKMKMHFGTSQNCGRPFCKLKKKDHYHCFECNQAFSDPIRLKTHVGKHGVKLDGSESYQGSHDDASLVDEDLEGESEDHTSEDEDVESEESSLNPSSSLSLNASTFSNLLQQSGGLMEQSNEREDGAMDLSSSGKEPKINSSNDGNEAMELKENPIPEYCNGEGDENSSHSLIIDESVTSPQTETKGEEIGCRDDDGNSERRSPRKRIATRHADFVDSDVAVKKQRRQFSPRVSKDDTLPEGFEKFRFCDECNFSRCPHSNMTHFHCLRSDCGYSFTDRTRIAQHQQRHERLDNIMGNEFEQFRQTMNCERPDCEHARKASHFHCLKCPFICTDSNKVLAHRKHHTKMDNIAAQGFEKFVGTTDCNVSDCTHRCKQTHYHCMVGACRQVVLGPAQMNPHSMKHADS